MCVYVCGGVGTCWASVVSWVNWVLIWVKHSTLIHCSLSHNTRSNCKCCVSMTSLTQVSLSTCTPPPQQTKSKDVKEFLLNFVNSFSDSCFTMWHKNYLSTSPNLCTHTTLYSYESQNRDTNSLISICCYMSVKTRGLKRKQFSIFSKHIICLHCYYEWLKCSPLAVTLAVRC